MLTTCGARSVSQRDEAIVKVRMILALRKLRLVHGGRVRVERVELEVVFEDTTITVGLQRWLDSRAVDKSKKRLKLTHGKSVDKRLRFKLVAAEDVRDGPQRRIALAPKRNAVHHDSVV